MALHVIVGAGPVGSATARLLVGSGHTVRVVTRSGRGPVQSGVERVASDAADPDALSRVAAGAAVLYNCANPQYHRWSTDWPPLAASLLATAERTGAVLVTMSNLYGYGPVDHPMRETDPLATVGRKGKIRVAMWAEALAAHRAGRVRVAEARASDYFGPEVLQSGHLGERVVPGVLAGRPVRVLGDPDVPHSWTYVPDIARALVLLGADERAWGKPWHVPSNPPMSQRAALEAMCRLAGAPAPKVSGIPRWVLRAGGLVSPMLRELDEVFYQFDRPFVLDSSAFTSTFGQQPTPMDEALTTTIAWWRGWLQVAA
jgi:nucleoside-diphosphate-sugar epimerase